MDERRRQPRLRALKGGRLFFNDGYASCDCTVRNLSPQGAKVLVENAIDLPDGLLLVLEDGTQHECKVVWRKVKELGLEFKP